MSKDFLCFLRGYLLFPFYPRKKESNFEGNRLEKNLLLVNNIIEVYKKGDNTRMADTRTPPHERQEEEGGSSQDLPNRRDFLTLTTTSLGGVGAACALWPFIQSMEPSADVIALSSIEVDLSKVAPGQSLTVMWRGKPVFIRHRTPEEIKDAESIPLKDLRDPEDDTKRTQKPEWLVVIGICTHLGCVPMGQKPTDNKGKYGGWFCSCHGSMYDGSGRIRQGPAPKNLEVPPYKFLTDTRILIG